MSPWASRIHIAHLCGFGTAVATSAPETWMSFFSFDAGHKGPPAGQNGWLGFRWFVVGHNIGPHSGPYGAERKDHAQQCLLASGIRFR
jgi:hypothetical protein